MLCAWVWCCCCFVVPQNLRAQQQQRRAPEPIKLHPRNPRYFLFRGKPTVLITSAEHYGAVLNLDFDFVPYLDELRARGHNQTRVFSGVMIEGEKSIKGIEGENTLAPRPGRAVLPWARSSTPGYANGGNKFDLTKFDPDYFARLKDFLAEAGRRGVVVELVLFGSFYNDYNWNLSPLKASNNVGGVGGVDFKRAYDLSDPALTEAQTALVRKFVQELKDFDNVYYEICNEPYFGYVTAAWNDHIARTIVEAEAEFSAKHLIAQNISNGSTRVDAPSPHVSVFNFHYSSPPESVAMNAHLNKPIAFDETGFLKTADRPYRMEAWDFILAGGAVYSNLDWSFTPAREGGTFDLPAATPGGGTTALRRQLQTLKNFIDKFDFVRMAPDDAAVVGGVPPTASARALVERGRAYAIYLRPKLIIKDKSTHHAAAESVETYRGVVLTVDLPAGSYRAEWLDTKTGRVEKREAFRHAGGRKNLAAPTYEDDVALSIKAAR